MVQDGRNSTGRKILFSYQTTKREDRGKEGTEGKSQGKEGKERKGKKRKEKERKGKKRKEKKRKEKERKGKKRKENKIKKEREKNRTKHIKTEHLHVFTFFRNNQGKNKGRAWFLYA